MVEKGGAQLHKQSKDEKLLNIVERIDDVITTSLVVAENHKRNHKEMLRTIRRRKRPDLFFQSTYIDRKGEQRPMFLITEEGLELLNIHKNIVDKQKGWIA